VLPVSMIISYSTTIKCKINYFVVVKLHDNLLKNVYLFMNILCFIRVLTLHVLIQKFYLPIIKFINSTSWPLKL
jgi:hypothetical protein